MVIPALDEEAALGPVLEQVDRAIVDSIVVADNGSADRTAEVARAGGAIVVHEPRRGYGSACLRALREGPQADLVVFMDGDGSSDPREIERLLEALLDRDADLVIGSRTLGASEKGALTPVQSMGNTLVCWLVRRLWDVSYTDLGPFRAIRREALERLHMSDPDFGWTIEMQVKAAQLGLRTADVPATSRTRRAGRSKVSGTIVGSFRAGKSILGYVLEARLNEIMRRGAAPGR
ncbi:MAG: glycosyltransferase family 2 protein [Candidatus Eisenbacteria bacterium]